MSTRVDKGGPKFKPILKAKGRPSATPAPHDVRTRPSAEPGISMPPPASLPERTPSVAPTPSVVYASSLTSSSAVLQPGPSVPSRITLNQPSRPLSGGTAIAATRPYTLRVEHTHPSLSVPIAVRPTTVSVAEPGISSSGRPLPSSTVISEPSRNTSGQPVSGPSRGVPITVFRPSPAPSVTSIPSTSNGKRRAGPETTESGEANDDRSDSHQNANSFEERGSVAQKRPKLSILQAEEDRVKRRPSRHSTSKNTDAETETDEEATEQSTTDAAGSKRSKRPRRKKTADENAAEATAEEGQQREIRRHAKRKKKQTLEAETPENAEASDLPSESLASPKKRRRRGATVEVAEPEGTSEPIDPTQIRMSAICDDLGSGRVSSRWESSQIQYADARRRAKEERARALAEADEEERETGRTGAKKGAPKPVLPGGEETANAAGEESVVENTGQNPDDFTYTETLKTSHYAPQVRIGANGEVVLDIDSLQVDRAADPELGEEPYSHVEESDQSRFTNNSSWSKRRVVRWGKEDTALFYDALRQFGQNFDLIARVLPGRTYRMCKNKFKAEDKKHPSLIDDALRNGIAVDLGALSRMTGKDFTGPTPVIEAKKTLSLREDDSAGTGLPNGDGPNAPETRSSGIDNGISVSVNLENVSSAPTARQSTSPPPPNPLLSSIAETRQSASPPPPSSLLEAIGGPESSSGALQESGATLSPSISIAAPVRTPIAISVSTRPGMQTAAAKVTTAVTSGPPVEVGARPSETSVKGQGESQAVHEDDVEILGLADQIDQFFPD